MDAPQRNQIVDNHRFIGGDPASEESWEPLAAGPVAGDIMDGHVFKGGDPSIEDSWVPQSEYTAPAPAPEVAAAPVEEKSFLSKASDYFNAGGNAELTNDYLSPKNEGRAPYGEATKGIEKPKGLTDAEHSLVEEAKLGKPEEFRAEGKFGIPLGESLSQAEIDNIEISKAKLKAAEADPDADVKAEVLDAMLTNPSRNTKDLELNKAQQQALAKETADSAVNTTKLTKGPVARPLKESDKVDFAPRINQHNDLYAKVPYDVRKKAQERFDELAVQAKANIKARREAENKRLNGLRRRGGTTENTVGKAITEQEIAAEVNAIEYPTLVKAARARKAEGSQSAISTDTDADGLAARTAKNVGSGGYSAVGAALSYIGRKAGAGNLVDLGDSMQSYAGERTPIDPTIYDTLTSAVGSTGGFYVVGTGVRAGSAALGVLSPALARWFGAGSMAAFEAAAEADGVWKELVAQGMSEKEAADKADKAFLLNVGLLTATDKYAFFNDLSVLDSLTGKISGKAVAKRVVGGKVSEGGQEAYQQVVGNYLTGKPLSEGVVESAGVGAVIGGAGAYVASTAGAERELSELRANEALNSIQSASSVDEAVDLANQAMAAPLETPNVSISNTDTGILPADNTGASGDAQGSAAADVSGLGGGALPTGQSGDTGPPLGSDGRGPAVGSGELSTNDVAPGAVQANVDVGSGTIVTKAGNPYKSERTAGEALKLKGLEESYEVAAVDGGFGLRPIQKTQETTVNVNPVEDQTLPAFDDPVLPTSETSDLTPTVKETLADATPTVGTVDPNSEVGILTQAVNKSQLNNAKTAAAKEGLTDEEIRNANDLDTLNKLREARGLKPVKPYELEEVPENDVRNVVTGSVQRAVKNILAAFGKKAIYLRDKNGQTLFFDGTYLGSKLPNSVFLDVNSGISVIRVGSHETLHALRRQAPDVYKVLAKGLSKLIDNGAGAKHLVSKGYIENEAEFDSTKLDSKLREELIADVFGDVLSDQAALNDMVAQMQPSTAKKFLTRARMMLDKMISKLKGEKTLGASTYADLVKARDHVIAAAVEYARRVDAGEVTSAAETSDDAGAQFAKKESPLPTGKDSVESSTGTNRQYKLSIEREARILSRRAALSEKETEALGKAASANSLSFEELQTVIDKAKVIKKRYPKSEGWAPLELTGVSVEEHWATGELIVEPTWLSPGYAFNRPPGATRAPAKVDEAWLNKVSKEFTRLVRDLYKRAENGDPNAQIIIGHQTWYRNVAEVLRREFGGQGDLLADLLGATSPNTPVDTNWRFSVEILRRFTRGEFNKELSAFTKHIDAGKRASTFADVDKIRQISGKLYGMNSVNAMKALADMWRVIEAGSAPKARNFALNLIAQSNMATIDVWAARMLRRAANHVRGASLLRIPPPAEKGVTGKWNAGVTAVTGEFGFGAAVLDKTSEALAEEGITIAPPDLQAIAWFAEKELWGTKGWTTVTGEGGSFEENLDANPAQRYLAGFSIQQGEKIPEAGDVSIAQVRVMAMLIGDDSVLAARAIPTKGLYGGTVEESFDTEWTVRKGEHDPSLVMAEIARIAKDNNQYDIFVSKVLGPKDVNPNARPGVEVYFTSEQALQDAQPILDTFVAEGQDGFTLVVDPRAKNEDGYIGVRLQYVPEISMRWDEGLREELLAPGGIEQALQEKEDVLAKVVANLAQQEGVAFASLVKYDTVVVGKENYDGYIDRVVGKTDTKTGAGVWFGQPIRQGLEGAATRLEGKRREVDAGGVPDAGDGVQEETQFSRKRGQPRRDGARVSGRTEQGDSSREALTSEDIGELLMERVLNDFENIKAEYAQIDNKALGLSSEEGRVLNTDLMRELSPGYRADRTRSADVHEASSLAVKKIYADRLAQPTPEGKAKAVLFTGGGTGAGKSTGLAFLGSKDKNAEIIYDTNLNGLESSIKKIEQALQSGRRVSVLYVYRDPVEALVNGALPRAERVGRTVPLKEHARTHLGSNDTVHKIYNKYKGNPYFKLTVIDNSRGRNSARFIEITELKKLNGFDGTLAALEAATEQAYQDGKISAATYSGTTGRQADDAAFSRKQIETPEFKKWFGDSKIVDADGKPLVVYHGTSADFTVFDTSSTKQFGAHFTQNKDMANEFTGADGGNVIPAFLSLKNPLNLVSDLGDWTDISSLKEYLGEDNYEIFTNAETAKWETAEDAKNALIKKGYDGIKYQNSFEGDFENSMGDDSQDVYIAFNPTQIKSATGNNGNFDGNNDDIMFSNYDQTQTKEFKKWFGDSKIVDADGKPLVVYRGDMSPIEKFKGSTFFGSEEVANQFADPDFMYGSSLLNDNDAPVVTPVYLSIKNPKIFTTDEEYDDYVMDGGKFSDKDWAKEGYDGVIYAPDGDIQSIDAYYKTLNPNQIKSATGNNGNFDDNNDDIMMSRKQGQDLAEYNGWADAEVQFSKRTKPDPVKTVKAYKLFRVDPKQPGKLFPLFVNAKDSVPVGTWEDADIGPLTAKGKVKSKLGPLAFRPGWHGGILPLATHIGEGGTPPQFRPANQVWAEIEVPADKDWQTEANKRGTNKDGRIVPVRAHITDQVPADGHYRYKTNPNMTGNWIIAGSMKVNRVLTDAEVEAVNAEAGFADLPRKAPFDAELHGFDDIMFSRNRPTGSAYALDEESGYDAKVRGIQNDQVRWKRQIEAIKERGGVVNDQNNVYQAMERMIARAMNRTEDFYLKKVQPVLTRMNGLGVTIDEVGEYLYAMHAKERNEAVKGVNPRFANAGYEDIGGSGMSDKEADEIIARVQADPNFENLDSIADEFRAWSSANLDGLVAGGLITPEAAEIMREKYPNYVPLKGFAEGEDDTGTGLGQGSGYSNSKDAVKRALGRGSRAGNPAVFIIHGVAESMLAREKANVGRYLERLILDNPDDKLWTIGQPDGSPMLGKGPIRYEVTFNDQSVGSFPRLDLARQYIRTMNLQGAEVDKVGGEETVVTRDMGYDPEKEVRFLRDGKQVRIQLKDPLLARAYNNGGMEQIGFLMELSTNINSFLREMWTQKNPVFPLVNMVRDVPSGMLYAMGEGGPSLAAGLFSNLRKSWVAMWKHANGQTVEGEMGQVLKEYRVAGGGVGFRMVGDIQSTMDKINRMEKRLGKATVAQALAGGEIKSAAKRALWRLYNNAVFDFIERANIAFENMTRLAIFKAARDQDHSMAEAARMSKNATVNFNRRGEKTQSVAALYLFFNAAVQDVAKNKRSLTEAPGKGQVKAALTGVALIGFIMGMLEDDDDNLDQENRNVNNLRFKLGEHQVSIPLSYGPIGVSHYLGRSLAKVARGESAALQSLRLASAFMHNMLPVNPIPNPDNVSVANAVVGMAPTPIEPLLSVMANANSWGSDLMPNFNKEAPNAYKAWRGTRGTVYASLAEFMNESTLGTKREPGIINVSPEHLKMLTHFLLGGSGKFVADAASSSSTLLQGGEVNVNHVPFLNRFVKKDDATTYRSRFYREASEAKEKRQLYNQYKEDRNKERMVPLRPYVMLGSRALKVWKKMNQLRDKELGVNNDESLTLKQKEVKLKEFALEQIRLSNDYHDMFSKKLGRHGR